MALTSFPLQSNFEGYDDYGNPIFDRAVDALFYRNFWLKYWTNGIFPFPADNFKVSPAGGMSLTVKLGEAHIQGLTCMADDTVIETLALESAEIVVDRVDRIVLRADFEGRRMTTVEVRKNWKAGDSLTRTDMVWELALADVLVRKSSTVIQAADITDLRLNTDLCGVVTEPIQRANTAIFYEQLQAEMERIRSEWDETKEEQRADWEAERDEQGRQFTEFYGQIQHWYAAIRADISKLQSFNFDNLAELPGVTRHTAFEEDGSIFEAMKMTFSGQNVATRNTFFNEDGSIKVAVVVYDEDGETVLKSSVTDTRFDNSGDIFEEVNV